MMFLPFGWVKRPRISAAKPVRMVGSSMADWVAVGNGGRSAPPQRRSDGAGRRGPCTRLLPLRRVPFGLSADSTCLIDDAYRCLFDRDVQSATIFHAALFPLMLVAAPTQTTSIISLKRSVSTKSGDRGSRPNISSVSLLMQLRSRFCLVSQRNQCRGVSSLFKSVPSWISRMAR